MTRIPAYHYVISNLCPCTLDIDKMKKMQKRQYKESISRPCPKAAELQYTSWWDGSGMKFEMGGMDPTNPINFQ